MFGDAKILFRWTPLLIALFVAARFATIGLTPLVDPSEGRYALISYEMAKSGDYVTPMILKGDRYVVFWGKPPLRFWTGALAFKIFGKNEFAARLPSFLSGLALVCLLYWIVGRYRSKDEGTLATLFFVSSGGFFFLSGVVLQEMTLALFTSGALLFYYAFLNESDKKIRYGMSLLVFICLGLGFMTKGPVALVVFGLPVFLWHLFNKRWSVLRSHAWWVGGALFLLITVPWFLMAEAKTPGFLRYFFLNENFYRFFKSDYGDLYGTGHNYPHGMAILFFLALSAPWCAVALYLVAERLTLARLSRRRASTASQGPAEYASSDERRSESPDGTSRGDRMDSTDRDLPSSLKKRALALRFLINRDGSDTNVEVDIFFLGFTVNTLFWCLARQIHLYYLVVAVPSFCVWLASRVSLPRNTLEHFSRMKKPERNGRGETQSAFSFHSPEFLASLFRSVRMKRGEYAIIFTGLTFVVYAIALLVMPEIVDRGKSTEDVFEIPRIMSNRRLPGHRDLVFAKKTPVSAYFYAKNRVCARRHETDARILRRCADENGGSCLYIVKRRYEKNVPPQLRSALRLVGGIPGWNVYEFDAKRDGERKRGDHRN